jgi:hypothetical protein
VSVEYRGMSNPESASSETSQAELEARLRQLDERLRSELRARGFDPAQHENLALPGPLARLYLERENLKEQLQILIAENSTNL